MVLAATMSPNIRHIFNGAYQLVFMAIRKCPMRATCHKKKKQKMPIFIMMIKNAFKVFLCKVTVLFANKKKYQNKPIGRLVSGDEFLV